MATPAAAAPAAPAAAALAPKPTTPTGQHGFNEHPQPRTFAPSKEDVLQNLQYFFGAPVSPEKLKDYSEHHAMTCAPPRLEPTLPSRAIAGPSLTPAFPLPRADHFPDAYAGQNTKIRCSTSPFEPRRRAPAPRDPLLTRFGRACAATRSTT